MCLFDSSLGQNDRSTAKCMTICRPIRRSIDVRAGGVGATGNSRHDDAEMSARQVTLPCHGWCRCDEAPECRQTSPGCLPQAAPRGLSLADLTEGRSPSCNGGFQLFSPAAMLPPRGRCAPKKPEAAILRLRYGRMRCRPIVPPVDRSPSRLRWSRARNSIGELTWLPSEPSRKPAMKFTAKS